MLADDAAHRLTLPVPQHAAEMRRFVSTLRVTVRELLDGARLVNAMPAEAAAMRVRFAEARAEEPQPSKTP